MTSTPLLPFFLCGRHQLWLERRPQILMLRDATVAGHQARTHAEHGEQTIHGDTDVVAGARAHARRGSG